ncbi:hypothetical protein EIP86_009581 [Pleurotus ostreatoroseus]|nr:hypothetical protein EIP86_009581 [Pleurotus ostreatoroseus]
MKQENVSASIATLSAILQDTSLQDLPSGGGGDSPSPIGSDFVLLQRPAHSMHSTNPVRARFPAPITRAQSIGPEYPMLPHPVTGEPMPSRARTTPPPGVTQTAGSSLFTYPPRPSVARATQSPAVNLPDDTRDEGSISPQVALPERSARLVYHGTSSSRGSPPTQLPAAVQTRSSTPAVGICDSHYVPASNPALPSTSHRKNKVQPTPSMDGIVKSYMRSASKSATWFEASSGKRMRHPPDLSSRSDLEIGDVFYNRLDDGNSQFWLWTYHANGTTIWKPIPLNYEREDGKRLTLTPTRQQPSWVTEKWAKTHQLSLGGYRAHEFAVERIALDGQRRLASGAKHETKVWKMSEGNITRLTTLDGPPSTSMNRDLEMIVTGLHWSDLDKKHILLISYMFHGVV